MLEPPLSQKMGAFISPDSLACPDIQAAGESYLASDRVTLSFPAPLKIGERLEVDGLECQSDGTTNKSRCPGRRCLPKLSPARDRSQPGQAALQAHPGKSRPSKLPYLRPTPLNGQFIAPAKVPAKIVSERLGHSSISLTMDTCSQVLPTRQKLAADELEATGLF